MIHQKSVIRRRRTNWKNNISFTPRDKNIKISHGVNKITEKIGSDGLELLSAIPIHWSIL